MWVEPRGRHRGSGRSSYALLLASSRRIFSRTSVVSGGAAAASASAQPLLSSAADNLYRPLVNCEKRLNRHVQRLGESLSKREGGTPPPAGLHAADVARMDSDAGAEIGLGEAGSLPERLESVPVYGRATS